jgi:hypothetical protein
MSGDALPPGHCFGAVFGWRGPEVERSGFSISGLSGAMQRDLHGEHI